jgi:hypothetical protein
MAGGSGPSPEKGPPAAFPPKSRKGLVFRRDPGRQSHQGHARSRQARARQFEPDKFEPDKFETALVDLVNQKRAGKPITAKERPRGENVIDLMEAVYGSDERAHLLRKIAHSQGFSRDAKLNYCEISARRLP